MLNASEQASAFADSVVAILPSNILAAPAPFAVEVFRPLMRPALPAPIGDVDPETGDFWRANQAEYWDGAAQAWRETATFSERQIAVRRNEIARCERRARDLRS